MQNIFEEVRVLEYYTYTKLAGRGKNKNFSEAFLIREIPQVRFYVQYYIT
jgi:hypothetical protein